MLSQTVKDGARTKVPTPSLLKSGNSMIKSSDVGEVKRMFIKHEYCGRGISKSLLKMVEQYAKKCGDHKLHLNTRITLEPAITLYRHSGFIDTFREGLYDEMEKKL